MNKIKFAFGIHNHQPIGNFDFVFEDAYQRAYLPFLQVLKKHPKIRMAVHFTGILLDWLEQNHPELLKLVRDMVAAGQLEVMSGAYYEPIISVIPPADRIGQIQKLTARVKELFGYEPQGMWLAERIWEPTLPATLNDAGISYTVIDDTHFKYAGLTDDKLCGYYLSEDLGRSVALFPISKHLRYTIPFQEPEQTIKLLRNMASEDGMNVLVFADDGEKFGVWPDTFRHVYENGWLDRFFSALEDNLDWIEMAHFSEIIRMVRPKDKIYLPTASYAEMMHWSLFPDTFRQYEEFEHRLQDNHLYEPYDIFVRGGFWRNFMAKYPEVNVMHKKMLRVSAKLWAAPSATRRRLARSFDHLWAGQCNCPYWHGVFGGLYLSHLRQAIFSNLIQAENELDAVVPPDYPVVEQVDFDVDGYEEVLVETAVHNAYFKPNCGAALFEYDLKNNRKNLLDTMTRREEGYHNKLEQAQLAGQNDGNADGTASIHDLVLTKEPDLHKQLTYDWYEKKSFIDHFLGGQVTIDAFKKAQYEESGDFVNQPYTLLKSARTKKGVDLLFARQGAVYRDGQKEDLQVTKSLRVFTEETAIEAKYTLTNKSGHTLALRFGVEFNFGLQAGHAEDRYYYLKQGKLDDSFLDSVGVLKEASFIGLRDEYLKLDIALKMAAPAEIWRMPVETISLSEAGFERVYQSSTVLLIWNLELDDEWNTIIKHKVTSI